MRQDINYKEKTVRNTNTWRLNNTFLLTNRLLKKSTWLIIQFSCSVVSDSATPVTAARQASLSITNSWSLFKLMSSNHLILCHPLLLLPSIFPSIRLFSNESHLQIRWAKFWSSSFNISPSDEHSQLISFRMD